MKVLSLFADTSARARALSEQIANAKDRYSWWFDHPVEWERPTQTLYITGWCVSRYGNKIRSIRVRRGRQKFLGNYGIERKDVGFYACHQPLPWVRPATQRSLGLVEARSVDTFPWAGSMMACNIPLQLSTGVTEGLLHDTDCVVMYSLAGGLKAAAAILRWGT